MDRSVVVDVRWANLDDLESPFFKNWNEKYPLPNWFWQRIWEYPYAALRVPRNARILDVGGTYPDILKNHFPNAVSIDLRDLNSLDHPLHEGLWPKGKLLQGDAASLPFKDNAFDYVISISALEEMPDPVSVINEMIRVSRKNVIITFDVSEYLGASHMEAIDICRHLGCDLPPIPPSRLVSNDKSLLSYGQRPIELYSHIRVLGFTIEAQEKCPSCAILVPHWESRDFLRVCLSQIENYKNNHVSQRVYIIDDDSKDGTYEWLKDKYDGHPSIIIKQLHRPNHDEPDVGLLIDWALDYIEEDYVCTIDVDVFPTSPHWLTFPIYLLRKYNCSSVGCDTGLSISYLSDHPRGWQNKPSYLTGFGLYDNENFTCTNNFYRIMPTSLAKVVSEQVGFSRKHRGHNYGVMSFSDRLRSFVKTMRQGTALSRIKGLKNLVFKQTGEDRFYIRGGDNGVAANHFIDVNRLGPKFNIPLISWIGLSPKDGAFGQNICDLVFHYALSTRALSRTRREINDPGDIYLHYARLIENTTDEDFDHLIREMKSECKLKLGGYDGSIPINWYRAQLDRFNQEFAEYMEISGQEQKPLVSV